MSVVSEPLKALVGHGQNVKHVKDCTELFLANQGIEQLAGFERLVNLEILWINDNKLVAINNLDNNIRIKQLYAHNNHICTLKGSLLHFKFLTHLDLSNNQLRDLNKLLKTFQKMHFLQELNLQGNPCCEEPDYRLLLIHAMPSLQVLDHHQVTTAERLKAAAQIGGDVTAVTVAFGSRILDTAKQHVTAADDSHGRSLLELELEQTAAALRTRRQQAAEDTEQALYAANPDASYWAPHNTLPPPPGVLKAQQAWAAAGNSIKVGGSEGTSTVDTLVLTQANKSGSDNVGIPTASNTGNYSPKDTIVIHSYRTRGDGLGSMSNSDSPRQQASSSPRHLQGTFRHHLTERNWELENQTLHL